MNKWKKWERRLQPYNNLLLLAQDILLVLVVLGFALAAWKAVQVGIQVDAMGCRAVCQSVYQQCAAPSNDLVLNTSIGK